MIWIHWILTGSFKAPFLFLYFFFGWSQVGKLKGKHSFCPGNPRGMVSMCAGYSDPLPCECPALEMRKVAFHSGIHMFSALVLSCIAWSLWPWDIEYVFMSPKGRNHFYALPLPSHATHTPQMNTQVWLLSIDVLGFPSKRPRCWKGYNLECDRTAIPHCLTLGLCCQSVVWNPAAEPASSAHLLDPFD